MYRVEMPFTAVYAFGATIDTSFWGRQTEIERESWEAWHGSIVEDWLKDSNIYYRVECVVDHDNSGMMTFVVVELFNEDDYLLFMLRWRGLEGLD